MNLSFPGPSSSAETVFVQTIRRIVLALFVMGVLGVGAELGLIGHYEDPWQWAPLASMGGSLLTLGWFAATRSRASLRTFQALMALFVVSGGVGIFLHFRGNMEFEREMVSSIKGWALIWESLTGATPALAPGAMIELGLLGWLYTFRHPLLCMQKQPEHTGERT